MTDRSHLLSALLIGGLLILPTGCGNGSDEPDGEDDPTVAPATPTADSVTDTQVQTEGPGDTPTEPPGDTPTQPPEATEGIDRDGDGFTRDVDCNDNNVDINPEAEEVCDEIDQDCDSNVDEGITGELYYLDKDGDGHGDEEDTLIVCAQPDGYVLSGDDCDDFDDDVYPEAEEVCDNKDNDCDFEADEGLEVATYFFDNDADGYGDDDTSIESCVQPATYVLVGGDCDDNDNNVNPSTIWFQDQDGDTYGDLDSTTTGCEQPNGYVINSDDCNDSDAAFSPDATEVCDGTDQDCDGNSDNNTECWDDDGDGFCEGACADGSTTGDCDDNAAYTYPDAPERYDGVDNNCDEALETGRVYSLSLAHVALEGWLSQGQVGKKLAINGNANGDVSSSGHEIDDLLIGAPNHDPASLYSGAAFLVMGRESGWPGQVTSLENMTDTYVFSSEQASASAGDAVSFLGDFNDDGYDDFAVGAPNSNGTTTQIIGAGSAFVFLGHETGWRSGTTAEMASTRIDGTGPNVELGTSLAGGDITGDDLPDLLIGAPDTGNIIFDGAGWVFVLEGTTEPLEAFTGPTDVIKLVGEAGYGMGLAVSYLGQHNDAQVGNFAASGYFTPSGEGMSMVMDAQTDWSTTLDSITDAADSASALYTGSVAGERMGAYLAGDMDINHDGYTDVLMGRTYRGGDTANQIAYLVFGGPNSDDPNVGAISEYADITFEFPQTTDRCPCAVASAGDMDGDGIDDFVISAAYSPDIDDPEDEGNRLGRIYLIYGREGEWPATFSLEDEADVIFVGTDSNGRAGNALAGAGDLNGDGYDDLAISAPYATSDNGEQSVTQSGRIYLQFGGPRPSEQ